MTSAFRAVLVTAAAAASVGAQQPAREWSATDPFAAGRAEFVRFPPPGAAQLVVRIHRPAFLNLGQAQVGGRAVTNRTIFQIASLTKPFTAIVILRLAEQGRLRLDDRAAQWLDWLPPAYRDVTIRQLLNHTSGVPRDLRRENVDEFSIEEFRRRFIAAQPSFVPGARWEYSNTGYILASLIAERAGGERFERLLEEMVFRPLGMPNSRYRAPLVRGRGRAVGYDWQDAGWREAPAIHSGYGNSGIESNAADLARFAAAMQRRELLQPQSYAEMLAPARLGSGEPLRFDFRGNPSSYGLGWFLSERCGSRVAMHGGTIAGFSSSLGWAVDRNLSAAALSNGKSGPDRIGLADKMAEALLTGQLGCRAG